MNQTNYDYFNYNDRDSKVCGDGAYTNVPYNPTITTIAKANGVELRSVERSVGTVYEIRWDNEVLVKYPRLADAETFFIDCANITRNKYKKIKAIA